MGMNLTKPQLKQISKTLEDGALRCAESLTKICRADWKLEKTAVGPEAESSFEELLAGASQDHLGSYLALPSGSAFLLMFDPKSGLQVSNRFIGDFSDRASVLDKLELQAIAEVSNILVNLLVDTLATASQETLVLPAPVPLIDSRRDLLINALKRFKHPDELVLSCCVKLRCSPLSNDCTLAIFLDEELIRGLLAAKKS